MKKHHKLLVLLSIISSPVWAGQYAVQLEASRSPHLEQYATLSAHGNLYTETANNGFIRTRLGPYKDKDTALNALNEVHAAGYKDAFIAWQKKSNNTEPSAFSGATGKQHDIKSFDVTTMKEWKMLTTEQQSNLVYLDGVLHIKNGDQFTSLDKIISQ